MATSTGPGKASSHPVEIELKYRLASAAAGERFLTAESIGPFVATSAARAAQHEDRYIDTSDGALKRSGFAARLRQTTAGTVVTVKSTGTRDGALQRREELEGPADRTAEPRDWPPSDARSLILELCGDAPLVELVTVRQLRRKRRLKDGNATAELSVDEVDVVSRGRVIDRFAELEVELTAGDESRLTAIRALFDADTALTPSNGSKLEAALAAARGRVRPGPGDRNRDDEAGERNGRLRAAEPATAPGEAPPGEAGVEPGTADRSSADTRETEASSGGQPRATDEPTKAAQAETRGATAPKRAGSRSRRRSDAAAGRSAKAAKEAAGQEAAGQGASPQPTLPDHGLVVGRTAGVTAEDAVAEAGRKVLRFHLARMITREAGTREGSDPEDLHAMRVATRRMRAAWRVFGGGFRGDRTQRYRSHLREVASRLGAVRDLDVLIEAGEGYLAAQPITEQKALQPLFAAWRAQRDDARVLLLRELDSDGYRRFVDDYLDFVRTEGAAVRTIIPTQPHRIRDTAGSRILASYEHVRAYEHVLRWADVPTLHELRIAAKWLRYTIEFVRESLGPDAATCIERIVALQDHLGLLHDADVAAAMSRAFLVEHSGRLSAAETAAIGRYLMDREREVARLRRSVGRPWRGVAGVAFRRALGRSVAAL